MATQSMPPSSWFLQPPLTYSQAAMRSQDGQGVNSALKAYQTTLNTATEVASAVDTITVTNAQLPGVVEAASAADAVTVQQAAANQALEAASAFDTLSSSQSFSIALTEAATAVDLPSSTRVSAQAISDTNTASDTVTAGTVFAPAQTETASAVDSQTAGVTWYLNEAANAVDTVNPTQQMSPAVAEAASAVEVLSPGVGNTQTTSDALTAVDTVGVVHGYAATIVDSVSAVDSSVSGKAALIFQYENAFAWEPPTRATFTVIQPGQPPMQTMILEKRTFDARPYDIICKDLLSPGATIANVNAVLADQGGLVFGTPVVNTQQNIYADGTIAPTGTVAQVFISGGTIPPLLSQLMCTVRLQFIDSNGASIEATVLLLLVNEVTA